MSKNLDEVRNAILANDYTLARSLLREALQNPNAEVYYLASQVALNQSQRIQFLEKAYGLDPFHPQVVEELARVNENNLTAPAFVSSPIEQKPQERISAQSKEKLKQAQSYYPMRAIILVILGMFLAFSPNMAEFTLGSDLSYADTVISIVIGTSIVFLIATSIYLFFYHLFSSKRRNQLYYQLETFVYWSSYSFVFVVIDNWVPSRIDFQDGTLLTIGAIWAFFMFVGGVLIFLLRNMRMKQIG